MLSLVRPPLVAECPNDQLQPLERWCHESLLLQRLPALHMDSMPLHVQVGSCLHGGADGGHPCFPDVGIHSQTSECPVATHVLVKWGNLETIDLQRPDAEGDGILELDSNRQWQASLNASYRSTRAWSVNSLPKRDSPTSSWEWIESFSIVTSPERMMTRGGRCRTLAAST